MDQGNPKMKVLVVDDDEPSRLIITTLARNEGHNIMEAVNGAEGLKLFESFQPDIIFSDISMPVMDGIEMLAKIREKSLTAVVIMTTAFGTAEFTLKALRLHANDYLVKPIAFKDIIAALRKYADVISTRSEEREVLGMILNRQLRMRLGNVPEIAGKVSDRLMQETEGRIRPTDRLGIRLGLVEIIRNAIEHGNLGITYDEKTTALDSDPLAFNRLISLRMADPICKVRCVDIQFQMDGEKCEWLITDEGNGFDWQSVPDPNDPANLLSSHGRGIMLTRLNFDSVSYLGKGNQVTLRKNLPAI